MKVGRRTQAYFVGLLIGIAIVSILIDARRPRPEMEAKAPRWERSEATLDSLPPDVVDRTGATGYVTAARLVEGGAMEAGTVGYFFADAEGARYWWLRKPSGVLLCDASKLEVVSRPGIEPDLMRAGFEHQGHAVLSPPSMAPRYRVGVDAHSAMEWVAAYENLRSKAVYIEAVHGVPLEE